MLFVENLTKSVQVVDKTLVAPLSVAELKTIKTKEDFVKVYGKDILKAIRPLQEQDGKKKVKEQKKKEKDAEKNEKEPELEKVDDDGNSEDEFFS